MKKQNTEDVLEKLTIRLPKSKKEMIINIVEKSSYNSISELVRAGIDKELNMQIYKDNLDFIIKELDNMIDAKLEPLIKAQRKMSAKHLRTSAINTYLAGEVLRRLLGDDMHKNFIQMLNNARKKANYYINRDTEGMSQKDLYDFYTIGEMYRNE